MLIIGLGLMVGSFGYFKARQFIIEKEYRTIEAQAVLAAQNVSARIKSIVTSMSILADNPVISSGIIDVPGASPYVKRFLQSFAYIDEIAVRIALVDFEGNEILGANATEPRPFAKKPIATALQRRDSTAWINKHDGETVVTVVLPLYYDRTGGIEGGLVYAFDLGGVLVGAAEENMLALLPENSLMTLTHLVDGKPIEAGRGDDYLTQVVPLMLEAPLKTLKLVLEVSAPKAFVLKPLQELSFLTVWVALVCIVFAVFFAYAVASYISRPIRQLDKAISDIIYTGRLDLVVEVRGKDETGRLCDSFNRMLDRLRGDFAQRERAEKALHRNEERFRTLIDHSAFGILVHRRGEPIYVNARLVEIFGYESVDEILELGSVLALYHPDDRKRIADHMEARWRGENVPNVYERRGLRKDGTEIAVEGRVTLMPWEGDISACVGLSDITEQRRTQAMLQQAQKMEVVGQMTGGVAHDFNNLLTVIIGNLEFIEGRMPMLEDANIERWAAAANRAAKRGAELTHRLLAFSRRQTLEPKSVNPNDIIASISDMLTRTLEENIEFTRKPDDDVETIYVDAAQLESALLNLVVNARDAMPNGGELIIETANRELDEIYCSTRPYVTPGQYVMIAVTDTGEGMPNEVVERVFEPFFTTKETGKGTGLGLSMVYGFMKQSGGYVTVYSEPGQGTTVRLYFPRQHALVDVQEDDQVAVGNGEKGDATVLVVEDDEEVRVTVVSMLETQGYCVLSAKDGPYAMKMLREYPHEIDLLFTDIVMPGGMTGIELAKEALFVRPGLKILYTSGYAENVRRKVGGGLENAMWLFKPYTSRQLAEKMRIALGAGGQK